MSDLTAEYLREALHYEPETGIFTWRVPHQKSKVGDVAGSLRPDSYRQIGIKGRLYLAHRLAILYVHGRFPAVQTDHRNGQRNDNRLANLREVSGSGNKQNQRKAHLNNTSGLLGVSWDARNKAWRAQIMVNGKQINLGNFPAAESAHTAYLRAKRELHATCTI